MESTESSFSGFAAAVNSRVRADARIVRSMAFAWKCGGMAAILASIGAGVAAALLGYSYVVAPAPAAELAARAIADALARAEIKNIISGTVALAPDAEISFAHGQTVKLAENSAVKLDQDSSIRVVGDFKIDVPQPSKQQLQLDTTSGSKELPFTNYTVFRYARFNSGSVVTGWSFELADPNRPNFQYCYYEETLANNVSASQTIGVNGLPRRPSALNKLSFDFDGAVANCNWYSG